VSFLLALAIVLADVWAQTRDGPLGTAILLGLALAFAGAAARVLWWSHRAALVANRYLSERLGFPVHYTFATNSPRLWRIRIKREVAKHARAQDSR
jgi:hypothetical protein